MRIGVHPSQNCNVYIFCKLCRPILLGQCLLASGQVPVLCIDLEPQYGR